MFFDYKDIGHFGFGPEAPMCGIAYSAQLVRRLKGEGISCVEAATYLSPQDWIAIAENSVGWIKRWPYLEAAGKSLIEWLHLDGFSLWWQLEGLFYYAGLGNYAEVGGFYNVVKLITLVRRILEQEEPEEVCFVDRGDLRAQIMRHLLDTMDVPYRSVRVRPGIPTIKEKLSYKVKTSSLHWLWDLGLYLKRRWRGWAYWLNKVLHRKEEGDKLRVLLVSQQGNGIRSYVDPSNDKVRHGDFYFAGVQEALLEDEEVQTLELQL